MKTLFTPIGCGVKIPDVGDSEYFTFQVAVLSPNGLMRWGPFFFVSSRISPYLNAVVRHE
jgi:hypothetical protein